MWWEKQKTFTACSASNWEKLTNNNSSFFPSYYYKNCLLHRRFKFIHCARTCERIKLRSEQRTEVFSLLMSPRFLPGAFQEASRIFTNIHQCLKGSETSHSHWESHTRTHTYTHLIISSFFFFFLLLEFCLITVFLSHAGARAFVLLIDILVVQGVSYTGQIVLMLWLNSIYQIYDVKKLLLNFSHWQMFCVYCMLCVSYSRMCKLWWRHWIRIRSRISFLPSQEKRSEDGHSHVSAFIFYLRTSTDFYFSLFVFVGSSSSTTGWRCLL